MLFNNPARFRRTRQHSASFSSPPSPQPKCRPRSRLLHFHRSVFACALAVPFGEGVVAAPPRPRTPQWSALFVGVIRPGAYCPGTDHASPLPVDCYCLGMASVLSIFACSRSSPLRSGSLLPSALPFTHARGTGPRERGHGERGTDEEPYRNPSPRPPPAILCGRGSRLHACEMFCPIRRRHPPRRILAPVRIKTLHCQPPLLQREAATAPEASDTVAAGVACVWHRQHHRQPIR